jgi:rhamnogalacturonan endolyase
MFAPRNPTMSLFFRGVLLLGLCCVGNHAVAAFGVREDAKYLTVDSGAGLVFKVNKSNGDVVSIHYKTSGELQRAHVGALSANLCSGGLLA